MFQAEHAQDADHIRTAWQNKDFSLAHRLAHTLKGLAGTLGADELREAAKQLEIAITKENGPFDEELLAQLEQKLAAVLSSITRLV
jgi:HPt (histidine-containing phosphotransfer) domain-containing protein